MYPANITQKFAISRKSKSFKQIFIKIISKEASINQTNFEGDFFSSELKHSWIESCQFQFIFHFDKKKFFYFKVHFFFIKFDMFGGIKVVSCLEECPWAVAVSGGGVLWPLLGLDLGWSWTGIQIRVEDEHNEQNECQHL